MLSKQCKFLNINEFENLLIQTNHFYRKCKTRQECPDYYRSVLAYGCGIAAILGLFTLGTLQCTKVRVAGRRGERRQGTNNVHIN